MGEIGADQTPTIDRVGVEVEWAVRDLCHHEVVVLLPHRVEVAVPPGEEGPGRGQGVGHLMLGHRCDAVEDDLDA